MSRIDKTTEPFFLQGHGERASTHIMMIHGFTSSPAEFRRLGYYLHDVGYTVDGILLPGHGTSPEDMITTGWRDWSGHVVKHYDAIKNRNSKKVIVIGHSMGGLLAMMLAMDRRLEGVISVSTPMFLKSRKTMMAVLLKYVVKYIEKKPTVAAHIIEEACTYTKMPIPCIVDLRKLLKLVKSRLEKVHAPIFVAQGELDSVVRPKSAAYIYQHVSSQMKQLTYYPNSSHAVLLDEERERVYEDIHRFVMTVQHHEALERALGRSSDGAVLS
ncbi:alpha/beta fold hydrolase [Paenibacillus sp. RC67]|uniref:alpha/beta hydrolase n=1 Tax=Paenibacillus sp. RC67 TaxID=3039392 RepID=UPI0024ADA9AE|nr:alpha/beta fold hydrolase [Paenibacillus sp. RC67]